MTTGELRRLLERFPAVPLLQGPTVVEPLSRLGSFLGGGPRLLIKRDDAIPFGFGGNKVRKLSFVAGRARAENACTLITAGAVQSNHARVTAATAARLGMRAILVVTGTPLTGRAGLTGPTGFTGPEPPTANALLDRMLGAEVVFVTSREERTRKMGEIADRLRADGRRPFEIPIGASTPLGALGYVLAVAELADQMPVPDVIIHSTSSGGTQAGLVAGCRLLGLPTRVIGVSADDSAASLEAHVRELMTGIADLLGMDSEREFFGSSIEVDDRQVGAGYGLPTDASREAIDLSARLEAIFLDPVYTAKAMAALISYIRDKVFTSDQTVLFWHTGGQVALFA